MFGFDFHIFTRAEDFTGNLRFLIHVSTADKQVKPAISFPEDSILNSKIDNSLSEA